jgi:hypothetical protein
MEIITEKLAAYFEAIHWGVAFTCVAVNYLIRKGTDDIKSALWFRLVGWIPNFWRAMVVSLVIGYVFWKTESGSVVSILNGVIWSHIIYEGAVKFIKDKFGLK